METITIPIEFKRLFDSDWREAAIWGGRYSLKSHTTARFLLIRARQSKIRIACFREFQNSIAESSHQLLADLINKYKLVDFEVTNNSIVNRLNGSDFIFKGLYHNEQSIKSIEGIDIAWCFVAGTLVDDKPIEDIKTGDYVKSYNHKTNKIEYRKVLRITKRKAPLKLYKLSTLRGLRCIIGTGEHPIYTDNGYVPLKDLTNKNNVYEEIGPTRESSLFGWLRGADKYRYQREKTEVCKKWWTFLLGLCKKKSIGADEGKKPDGQSGNEEDDDKIAKESRTQTNSPWREWQGLYQGATNSLRKTWQRMVERNGYSNRKLWQRKGHTDKLQNRFGKCLLHVSDRVRWRFSHWKKVYRRRREKEYDIKKNGLDGVEIQEQEDIKRLGLSDGGNYVYNLEVEVNNNYFANGILVHNCEEAQSISSNSLEVLTPTVRKPGSKIIYTYNRLWEEDPVHKRVVIDGRPNTLKINVNYDVAVKHGIMPEEVLNEIEDDKKNRPALYKHKWLGEPNNLERKIYRDWKIIDGIPHEARLERRYLDFGYSNDQSAIGEVYYYNGGWILNELLYQKGMSNKQLADFLNGLPRKETMVVADSAEPKSIDEIRAYGVNIIPCVKGKDSVKAGIQLVQDQPTSVTKQSTNLLKEYYGYFWAEDKEGRIINVEDPKCPNHHMSGIRYALATLGRLKQEANYWDRVFEDELNPRRKAETYNKGR